MIYNHFRLNYSIRDIKFSIHQAKVKQQGLLSQLNELTCQMENIMQINFTGHQMEVTPALKAFTQEKFNKLERHFDKITSIHVIFVIEKLQQIAEAKILITKAEVVAQAESENMYTSIDLLVDKLDKQLIKHKEKIQDHRDHREKDRE